MTVADTDLKDSEQFALGTYSPLRGFMDRETLNAVMDENRLPGSAVWTMPLLLQVDTEVAHDICTGQRIVLKSATGFVHSLLDINEIYSAGLIAIVSFTAGITATGSQILMQTGVEGHMRGRVMSLYAMTWRGAPALGALILG